MKDYNITMDKIEELFVLEEMPITNKKEIIKYFDEKKVSNKN